MSGQSSYFLLHVNGKNPSILSLEWDTAEGVLDLLKRGKEPENQVGKLRRNTIIDGTTYKAKDIAKKIFEYRKRFERTKVPDDFDDYVKLAKQFVELFDPPPKSCFDCFKEKICCFDFTSEETLIREDGSNPILGAEDRIPEDFSFNSPNPLNSPVGTPHARSPAGTPPTTPAGSYKKPSILL